MILPGLSHSLSLHSVLHPLWGVALQTLEVCMKRLAKKHSPTYLYTRLYEAADILRGFFHADGNGLGDVDLETAQYKVSSGLPYRMLVR